MQKKVIAEFNHYNSILDDHKDYETYKSTFTKLKKIGLHIITIKELLSVVNNGFIGYYEKNRGAKGLTQAHIDRLANEFDYNSLGILSMIYDKKKKCLMTIDGSHRLSALCQLAANDKLKRYWNKEVVIKIVDDKEFLTLYQNINSGIAHTRINTLTNTDLAYGKLIAELVKTAQIETGMKNVFPRKNYAVLSFILYSLIDHVDDIDSWMEDWSYEHVWGEYNRLARKDTRKAVPKISTLKLNQCANLIPGIGVALEYLHELMDRRRLFEAHLKQDIPDHHARKRTLNDTYPVVIYNDTIIGYLICAGSRKIHRLEDVDHAVTQIMKRGTRLGNMINRGNGKKIDKFAANLYLDRAIFGDQVKASDLNYIINK